jgi:hypothetical protein
MIGLFAEAAGSPRNWDEVERPTHWMRLPESQPS